MCFFPLSKVKCIFYKSYLYPNFRYFLPFYSLCSFFWKMMVISWLLVFLCDLNLLNIKMKFLFFSFLFLSLLSFFSFLSHTCLFVHSLLFSCVVKFKGVENMVSWPLTGHQAILFNCQWLPCSDHAGPLNLFRLYWNLFLHILNMEEEKMYFPWRASGKTIQKEKRG